MNEPVLAGEPVATIATWNVNGIRARQGDVLDWLAQAQPDVLCLQELKATPAEIPTLLFELAGYWCYWHGGKGYSGVGILVRKAFWSERPRFEHPPFDYETRIVTVALGGVTIASIYVPNGGKDFPAKMHFLAALADYARDLQASASPIVLCGDFNVARQPKDVHPLERKPGAFGQRPDEREAFERLVGHGLTDVARRLDPDNDRLFTWWAPWRSLRQRNIGWRLDYILASEPLAGLARASTTLREVGTSDHGPVLGCFAWRPQPPPPAAQAEIISG